jgi:hypothetical protein
MRGAAAAKDAICSSLRGKHNNPWKGQERKVLLVQRFCLQDRYLHLFLDSEKWLAVFISKQLCLGSLSETKRSSPAAM